MISFICSCDWCEYEVACGNDCDGGESEPAYPKDFHSYRPKNADLPCVYLCAKCWTAREVALENVEKTRRAVAWDGSPESKKEAGENEDEEAAEEFRRLAKRNALLAERKNENPCCARLNVEHGGPALYTCTRESSHEGKHESCYLELQKLDHWLCRWHFPPNKWDVPQSAPNTCCLVVGHEGAHAWKNA